MDLSDAPFFGLLRERLGQLSQRQRLIAENIANASTPGFMPRDVDASAFQAALDNASGARLARTNARHMAANGAAEVTIVERADSETTLDGNAVVLEEQTVRAAETRMQYETALALYQRGLELMRMATRPPGR